MEHTKPFTGQPLFLIYNLDLPLFSIASFSFTNSSTQLDTRFTCLQSLHLPYCCRFISYPTLLMTRPSQNTTAPSVLSGVTDW